MPDTYEVQAPDGRTLEIQSEHQPTPQDALRAIRAYGDHQAAQAQAKAEAGSTLGAAFRPLAKGALDALPGIGAVVGGVLSTPETGGAGTIPGIALGAGAGRGVRDLITAGLGMEKPSTALGEGAKIAGETALTGATAAILPGAVAAAKTPIQTLREGAEQFGSALPPWVRRLGNVFPSVAKDAAPILERPAWQTWGEPAPPPMPEAPTGPHMDLSRPIQPGTLTQQQILERMRAVQQAGGTSIPAEAPKPMLGGRLQMAPTERPPITVAPESPMQLPDEAPMLREQPRGRVGAEVVGRQNGVTKQQVRDITGPIRGEAQGAAAGMPSTPMDRIVQKLIDMGPKGQGLPEAARESYAAAGTSDKTRVQVQAYLDALRKVGFVGAGTTGAEAVRQAVMSRLRGSEEQ